MATKLKARPPAEIAPGRPKGVLFGKWSVGKTWLALSFPSCYYIDTEGGAKRSHYMERLAASGGKYLGPEDGSCNFDVILEQVQALATEKHEFRTLVIDSISKVYQSRIADEAARLGSKDAFGASKKPAIACMRQLMNWIGRIDMNVWFLAHEVSEWAGTGGDRVEVGKTADVWDKLIYDLDLTLHLEKHSKGFRTATAIKSRMRGFPEGERFEIQKDGVDVGYANFAERYGRDVIEALAQPIVLLSEEQATEIARLLTVVKVEEKDLAAILARAGVESVAELSKEHGDKMIDWLKKKVVA